MVGCGEKERDTIRPEFDRSIMIDFQGAKTTSDAGFLLLREIDERFGILGPIESELEDTRFWVLPPSDLVGSPPGASSVSGGHCREAIPLEAPRNSQGSGIIPIKS
jgi:hypothetical protein